MPYAEGPPRSTEGVGQRPVTAPPQRRTVTIRGQVADRRSSGMVDRRRRPPRRPRDRATGRPDRVALWAVLLCLLLLAAAATSSHAAVRLHRGAQPHVPALVGSPTR
jgi:hypothetical protein